jgi:hypothetical protein
MQLVAYGAQDVYLTGQPQITFFKVVYRRHTNFSVEPIQQTFQGAAEFGRTVTCNVNRNGDLITNMYLVATLKSGARTGWGYVSRLGHAMIESCKIEVGGSKIDEQYGDWLNVWYELTRESNHDRGYAQMIGDVDAVKSIGAPSTTPEYTMYIPLQFWFNRNNGLALPLIALQYHDVRVTIKMRESTELVNYTGTTVPAAVTNDLVKDAYLLIDYVYLDSEERKRFAQAAHEYLIEQVQFTGDETYNASNLKYRLNFNHPSKFLVWNVLKSRFTAKESWVAWAFDGDWAAARERFAKYIWLASRSGFGDDGASTYSVTLSDGTFEVGDTPGAVTNITSTYTALLAKIDAQILFTQAAGSTDGTAAAATAANVVILRNELTNEDLNTTLSELTTALGTAGTKTVATAFLTANAYSVRDYFNYSDTPVGTGNPVKTAKLQLNGHDRFTTRDGNYFNYVQPYQHFSNTPADGINVYSFALKPEDHQPSGTCNFSRIDNTTLNIESTHSATADDGVVKVYAVNYNVFRVMSGMGGLAYSN